MLSARTAIASSAVSDAQHFNSTLTHRYKPNSYVKSVNARFAVPLIIAISVYFMPIYITTQFGVTLKKLREINTKCTACLIRYDSANEKHVCMYDQCLTCGIRWTNEHPLDRISHRQLCKRDCYERQQIRSIR